jgi:hypothetical protein
MDEKSRCVLCQREGRYDFELATVIRRGQIPLGPGIQRVTVCSARSACEKRRARGRAAR